jgi:hypothetical protein
MNIKFLLMASVFAAAQLSPAHAQEFVFQNIDSQDDEEEEVVGEVSNGSIVIISPTEPAFIMTGSNSDEGGEEGPPGDGPPIIVPIQPLSGAGALPFEITSLDGVPIFDGPASIYFTTATEDAFILGSFQYRTFDEDGGFDPAGYFIDEAKFQLSDDSLEFGVQSGTFSFNVLSGNTWGFYIESTDNCCGFSQFAVNTTFDENVVPEPASWAMLIAGFGLVGGAMRRRRSGLVRA